MVKKIIKYSVKTIFEDSIHDAVEYLDDESMLIVEDNLGNWWKADEFFYIQSINEFFIEKESN